MSKGNGRKTNGDSGPERKKRLDKLRHLAAEQGLVIVRISPRRYLLVDFDQVAVRDIFTLGYPRHEHLTYIAGRVLHKGSWQSCCRFIVQNINYVRVPKELTHD